MITFSQGGEAKIYDAPCLTKSLSTTGGTLDKWVFSTAGGYSRQLEMLSTTEGTLDNWMYFGQLEVLWTTGGTLDNWRYFGQLEVLWTTGGTLDKSYLSSFQSLAPGLFILQRKLPRTNISDPGHSVAPDL